MPVYIDITVMPEASTYEVIKKYAHAHHISVETAATRLLEYAAKRIALIP